MNLSCALSSHFCDAHKGNILTEEVAYTYAMGKKKKRLQIVLHSLEEIKQETWTYYSREKPPLLVEGL